MAAHYSCDPEKDGAWAAQTKQGRPSREWSREYEMREDIYDGEPVYADYVDGFHCKFLDAPFKFQHGWAMFGGWDAGTTVHPAFELKMVSPFGQVVSALEVVPSRPEPMNVFAAMVRKALNEFCPGSEELIEHWGDPTIQTRSGTTGDSARGVARAMGFDIKLSTNDPNARISAVNRLLVDRLDGAPRYVIAGKQCPTLREGFQGAYRYDESPRSEGQGGGRMFNPSPLKNGWSHVHDAAQYSSIAVWRHLDSGKSKFARAAAEAAKLLEEQRWQNQLHK